MSLYLAGREFKNILDKKGNTSYYQYIFESNGITTQVILNIKESFYPLTDKHMVEYNQGTGIVRISFAEAWESYCEVSVDVDDHNSLPITELEGQSLHSVLNNNKIYDCYGVYCALIEPLEKCLRFSVDVKTTSMPSWNFTGSEEEVQNRLNYLFNNRVELANHFLSESKNEV